MIASLGIALLFGVAGSGDDDRVPQFDERQRTKIARLSPLAPVPADPTNRFADDPRAARLGHVLFFDERLSANRQIACATCHDPAQGFGDGKTLSVGLKTGTRHAPSLWNVGHQRWFFWDGRADSLWAQALGPLENSLEMGSSRTSIAHLVAGDAELRASYEALFGPLPPLEQTERFPQRAKPSADDAEANAAWSQMDAGDRDAVDRVFSNVGKALAAYERKLVTTETPFDRFARGLQSGAPEDLAALSPSAQRGLELFIGRGRCILCHVGSTLSDLEFHNTSAPPLEGGEALDPGRYRGAQQVARDPFNAAGTHSDAPEGEAARRVRALRQTSDSWGEFKTPGLRNVAQSPPYMHQGQFATLEDVVRFYSTLEGSIGSSHHQEQILVPLNLSEAESEDLLAFLRSLSSAAPESAWSRPPAASAGPR